jgi:hypothetical protein
MPKMSRLAEFLSPGSQAHARLGRLTPQHDALLARVSPQLQQAVVILDVEE